MVDFSELFVQENLPEATYIQFSGPRLEESEQCCLIEAELTRLIESGERRFILDFSRVDYLSSGFLGLLIRMRRLLIPSTKSLQGPHRPKTEFAFFRDKAAAIEAIRRGESERLLLCGVARLIMEVFSICKLIRDNLPRPE